MSGYPLQSIEVVREIRIDKPVPGLDSGSDSDDDGVEFVPANVKEPSVAYVNEINSALDVSKVSQELAQAESKKAKVSKLNLGTEIVPNPSNEAKEVKAPAENKSQAAVNLPRESKVQGAVSSSASQSHAHSEPGSPFPMRSYPGYQGMFVPAPSARGPIFDPNDPIFEEKEPGFFEKYCYCLPCCR